MKGGVVLLISLSFNLPNPLERKTLRFSLVRWFKGKGPFNNVLQLFRGICSEV